MAVVEQAAVLKRDDSMGKPLRVLVLEDSGADYELLLHELRRGGYEPDSARVQTAEDMKNALADKTWDVILADFSMPQFDAFEGLKIVHEMELSIPYIIVSGTIGEDVAIEAMRAGAHDYLMKSNLRRLVPAVERELGEAEVRKERRRAEDALRESEERYATLFRSAAEGILVADMETKRFVYANPSICRMLGYSEQEMKRLGVQDIHPAESLEHVRGEFEAQALGKRPLPVELPCRRKDGSVIYANIAGSGMILNKRHCNVGFFSDVTERRRMEEALRRSEEQYRLITENSFDPIWVMDLNLAMKFVSPPLCQHDWDTPPMLN